MDDRVPEKLRCKPAPPNVLVESAVAFSQYIGHKLVLINEGRTLINCHILTCLFLFLCEDR